MTAGLPSDWAVRLMTRTLDPTTPIRKAIKRLAVSDTPLTRRNARRELRRELKALWKEYDEAYRALRKDGTEVIPRKSAGAYCPKCNTPTKTWAILVDHMARHHPKIVSVSQMDPLMGNKYRCSCGYTGKRSSMARHLSGQSDMAVHFCATVITQSNQE